MWPGRDMYTGLKVGVQMAFHKDPDRCPEASYWDLTRHDHGTGFLNNRARISAVATRKTWRINLCCM